MKRAALWPIAIVGVLLVTVGANGYLLYRATDGSTPIEADYYRKAIAWDSTMAQSTHNQALGWRVEATLGTDGQLAATVTNAAGTPIDGARVDVEGFPVAYSDGNFAATLNSTGAGYGGSVTVHHRGLYELRFAITRGTDRFTTTLRGSPGTSFAVKT